MSSSASSSLSSSPPSSVSSALAPDLNSSSLFGGFRRIVTYHDQSPTESSLTPSSSSLEPGVRVRTDEIHPRPFQIGPSLSPTSGKEEYASSPPPGIGYMKSVFKTSSSPAISTIGDPSAEMAEQDDKLVVEGGTNLNLTDLPPNTLVGMHRTHSVDYNIVLEGSVCLITPRSGGGNVEGDIQPDSDLEETWAHAGDVVVQRGTLHGWKSGPKGVRWLSVLVHAEPVKVAQEGGEERLLEEVLL